MTENKTYVLKTRTKKRKEDKKFEVTKNLK